jgi:hypothetical protein
MPVPDSPVHESTIAPAFYDACANAVRKDGYWHSGVEVINGLPVPVTNYIIDRSSRECRYDKSLTDPQCAPCPRKGTGEAYAKQTSAKCAEKE